MLGATDNGRPMQWSLFSFSYSNSSNATIIKKLCKSKKLVKSQSGHTEKPFAGHPKKIK